MVTGGGGGGGGKKEEEKRESPLSLRNLKGSTPTSAYLM